MIPRPLGRTGVSVNPVGLGCMSLSGFYGRTDEAEAMRVLAAALDLGVNFWDTANVYGEGLSETRLGKFFAEDGARRERVTLATKFAISRDAEGKRFIDNSEAHMIAALDGSLKRLGIDHVDLYYVHRLDPRFPVEETVGALTRQIEKGKIRSIGLSEIAPDTLRRACAVHAIAAVQSEYSLWTRGPELGMLQACQELDVAFVAFSPVGRGALGGQLRDPATLPASDFRKTNPRFTGLNWTRNLVRIDAYVELARSFDRDPGELALAWALAQGPHILTIPGTRYAETLAHDARAADKPLTPAEAEALARALPPGWAAGDRYTEAQWANIERYC